MSSPTILDFLFDEENQRKIARHGLTASQVLQVLDSRVDISPNKRRARATQRVIGRDHGGQAIAVFVEPTHDPVVWRPVTARPAEPHEKARL